jgi:hypothetical protein
LTPVQVRDALRNTASNAASPNNSIGWGIINVYKAVLYNGMVISTDPEITLTQDSNYSVTMTVVSPLAIRPDSIRLYYRINKTNYFSIPMTLSSVTDAATNSGKYQAVIPKPQPADQIYFYVTALDASGITRQSPYGAPDSFFDLRTGMMYVPRITPPSGYALEQNYPNPFNPTTQIRFSVAGSGYMRLKIFDLLGREISTLIEQTMTPGTYTVEWNASRYPSGVYFYRLQTESFTETKKMVLVR